MKLHSKLLGVLFAITIIIGFAPSTLSQSKSKTVYIWDSPNAWTGGNFSIPPWFAEDLNYHGHEVLHFHPDYYNYGEHGFWSYNFALIVNEIKTPTTQEIITETQLYFVGLGRTLGDKKDKNLNIKEITVKSVSNWKTQGNKRFQDYSLRAFDSWETGKAIMLNVRVTTWLCKGGKHRAVVYSVSPQNWNDPIWEKLNAEADSFSCD